jgi:hypothetical protein
MVLLCMVSCVVMINNGHIGHRCLRNLKRKANETKNNPSDPAAGISGGICVNHLWPVVAGGGGMKDEAPVQEPVWIQPDHLQKAQKAPFLCRVEPHKRDDFVPLYPTPPAAQPAPVQPVKPSLWEQYHAAQPAPVHPDSARIDWLTNNPLDALDIFGHVKGSDAVRWIRQEIDNAMLKKDGATHD